MYIQPIFENGQGVLAVGIKRGAHFECVIKGTAPDRHVLTWLQKRIKGQHSFIFYDAEDLYRLNAVAITAGVDLSRICRHQIVPIVQYVHSVARLQRTFRAFPTVKMFAKAAGYPRANELVEQRKDLTVLPASELRCSLSEMLDAIEYIHRRLQGYLVAAQTLRSTGGLWR
jgi:hypothetical protein